MPVPRSALIVGAGIGGLAAGLALRHAGWSVRIFERARDVREVGFALLLAPNAIAALEELGVAEAIVAAAATPTSGEVRRTDGRLLRRIDVADSRIAIGGVPRVALRTVLHGTLLDAVGRDTLTLGAPVVSVSVVGGHPSITLASGETVEGDVVIGADGVHSAVRRTVHPGEAPPHACGIRALRGVVWGTRHFPEGLDGTLYLGRGVEAAVVKAGPDVTYFYVSCRDTLVADVAPEPAPMLARAHALLDDRFRALTPLVRPEDLRVDDLVDRSPLPHWGIGRVTLLGDAAHPLLPHTGQGAAQALEDAVALGRALHRDTGLPEALRRYEQVRARRTRTLLVQGRRFAATMRSTSPTLAFVRDSAVRLVPKWMVVAANVMGQKVDPYQGL